jgi:hypothetical protein
LRTGDPTSVADESDQDAFSGERCARSDRQRPKDRLFQMKRFRLSWPGVLLALFWVFLLIGLDSRSTVAIPFMSAAIVCAMVVLAIWLVQYRKKNSN